jgi:hypothetical protein
MVTIKGGSKWRVLIDVTGKKRPSRDSLHYVAYFSKTHRFYVTLRFLGPKRDIIILFMTIFTNNTRLHIDVFRINQNRAGTMNKKIAGIPCTSVLWKCWAPFLSSAVAVRIWVEFEAHKSTYCIPPDHLSLDSAPNLGPLISRWEINKFKNCWYKTVRILEVLKLCFSNFWICQVPNEMWVVEY